MSSVQDAVKIMAKDLVRTRRYVKKFIMMRANIQAVSLKVQVSHHCTCGSNQWREQQILSFFLINGVCDFPDLMLGHNM